MPASAPAVPLLDLKAQYAGLRDEVRAAVDRVLESQNFILGPEVEALEAETAEYCDCKYAVGLSSGSDALLVGLMALGVKADDEVIVPSYTFFATAGAVARLGARPVFVDVDPRTFNLTPEIVEAAITDKTRAIIPVHLYGQMADVEGIVEVARSRHIPVIEDACQAIGAERNGRRAGSVGDLGCFSFFPTKNLGGIGDGGLVATNSPAIADRIQLLRNHGCRPRYYHKTVGGNFRLDAIQAAVLRVKLAHLDDWTAARQRNAHVYRALFAQSGLAGSGSVVLPAEAADVRHVYNQFVIRLPAHDRNSVRESLASRQIGTEIYYPAPLHLQECFAYLGARRGDLPHSEGAADQTLALPIYPELTDAQLDHVARGVRDYFSHARASKAA